MKFSAVLVSAFVAVALAQSGSETGTAATPKATSSFTPEQKACMDAAGTDARKVAECLGMFSR